MKELYAQYGLPVSTRTVESFMPAVAIFFHLLAALYPALRSAGGSRSRQNPCGGWLRRGRDLAWRNLCGTRGARS
jgi:hypothetical protein